MVFKIIKDLRINQLWTQKELAKKMNVKTKVISKWEEGKLNLTDDDIERLASVFEVEKEVFLKEDYEIINDNKEIIEKKDKKFIIGYNILFVINVLLIIAVTISFLGAFKTFAFLYVTGLLIINFIVFLFMSRKDLKTIKTLEKYKKLKNLFLAIFLYFVIVALDILFVLYLIRLPSQPHLLIIVGIQAILIYFLILHLVLFYFIYKKEKKGIIIAAILVILEHLNLILNKILPFNTLGFIWIFKGFSFVFMIWGIILLITFNYKKEKGFKTLFVTLGIVMSIIHAFISSFGLSLMDSFNISYAVVLTMQIVYSLIILGGLVLLIFFNVKKTIIIGTLLYFIYLASMSINYFIYSFVVLTYSIDVVLNMWPYVLIMFELIGLVIWQKYANFERLEKKKTIISLLIILMIFDIAVVVLGHTGINIYYSFLYGKVVPEIRIACYLILLVLVILKGLMKKVFPQV
ncbi:MAG: helix-turn-helix domain-containing protein [Bacilli bacterium]